MVVRSDYDVVLIDTPPMLHMPDARILARLADALVLVIRAGHTSRDAALAANQRFVQDGTRVLGIILNDWDPKRSAAGYYGYEEYYRSDSGDETAAVA
jgi:Mrp family chromosome partitioning ATPase